MTQPRRRHALLAPVLAGVLLAACSAAPPPGDELGFDGPDDDVLNAETAQGVEFVARIEEGAQRADLDDLVVLLDGEDVTADARVQGSELTYAPALEDGERVVAIGSSRGDDADEVELLREWHLTVDTVAPEIELTAPEGAVIAGQELTVAGATKPGSVVEVGSERATADEEGRFELVLAEAPDGALSLVATDEAGNVTADEVSLVSVPSRVETDEIRSVHVSFCGWATPSLREPVLELIDEGLITAVQLDLKDETGKVGYDTDVELAERIGADEPNCLVDLQAAVAELHELGVPVIGRIVAFADPVLAQWAWANGERDWVTQTADGEMFVGKYAGFSNFAHPEMVEYNIAIAEEAAALGVDHILWDYIRKPDGPFEQFHFAGLETSPEESLVAFTRAADERLAPYGVLHGASLYGVSADRPTEVSQDVEAMAEHLDYVAPMIYPSHWGPGEYDVANPLEQPYDMVAATLEIWQEATEGKRARVLPWLEDSNWPVRLGYPDRAQYVREQIQGTYDSDIDEWLLWDSAVKYTTAAMIQPGD
jgi:hypothetical protein